MPRLADRALSRGKGGSRSGRLWCRTAHCRDEIGTQSQSRRAFDEAQRLREKARQLLDGYLPAEAPKSAPADKPSRPPVRRSRGRPRHPAAGRDPYFGPLPPPPRSFRSPAPGLPPREAVRLRRGSSGCARLGRSAIPHRITHHRHPAGGKRIQGDILQPIRKAGRTGG
jgi:hypothetical protein